MARRAATVGWLAACGVIAFIPLLHAGFAATPAEPRSVRDGVYIPAQARSGAAVYRVQCVECHQDDLRGRQMTPSLVGVAFAFRWNGRRLYDYFQGLRATMPQNAPGSLSDRTYVDLVAYLLAANGYPAGDAALFADPETLSGIVIEADFQ